MYSTLFAWVGWYYIPHFATRHLLQGLHQLYPRVLRSTPPPSGTPAYRRHYRWTYSAVVLGYLLYNLVEGARSLPPNFYQILGVPPVVDEGGLKNAFRQFAKKNHPDRPGIGADGEALFIMVRDVFEALKNPVVRFAYDRFGPDVLRWQNLSTQREYLRQGIMQSSGYHLSMGLGLLVISSIGKPSPVKYWRYMLYLSLLAAEFALLFYSSPSPNSTLLYADPSTGAQKTILHVLFPQRVAFQHILFLHQLFMFLSTALTNVAPYLFPDDSPSEYDVLIQKFNALAGAADREASALLHTELHSIHPSTPETRVSMARMRPRPPPSAEVINELSKEMENMLIEKNVMQEVGPLRSVWEHAIEQGRREAALQTRHILDESDMHPDHSLPSPVSPSGTPSRDLEGAKGDGRSWARLPSPRPSPPPSVLLRRGSSYTRARSVSY